MKTCSTVALLCLTVALPGCGGEDSSLEKIPVPGMSSAMKSIARRRAKRRAFDGAPPTIPHVESDNACTSCHNKVGVHVPGWGFAPPMPHGNTEGIGETSNCRQCHVLKTTKEVFKRNLFTGLPQDLRRGERRYEHAPPLIPHNTFMREDCSSCHTGPAAREEVRCTHPQREACRQCHLPQNGSGLFKRVSADHPAGGSDTQKEK